MADPSLIGTIPNDYSHYSPLDTDKKEIRLLHILPAASNNDMLVVAVVHTKLADCPEYRALSYCWGSLEETRIITALFQNEGYVNSTCKDDSLCASDSFFHSGFNSGNGATRARFNITTNLHAALSSFHTSNSIGFIWVDMLCINQGDVNERSGQVGIMKSVYATADSVIVWLGDGEELHSALFAADNYELALFSLALRGAGWNPAIKLNKFIIEEYVKRMQREEIPQLSPNGSAHSSPFVQFLSKYRSRMRPVLNQEENKDENEREPDAEIDEINRESIESFLLWLHLPFKFLIDDTSLKDPFMTYFTNIMDHQSVVWQWLEFSIAAHLKVITHDRLLQPPQSVIRRMSTISSNEWFRRAWVLQEVANKSNVSIRVSTDEIDWVVFLSLLTVILEVITTCVIWNHYIVPSEKILPPIWIDISGPDSKAIPIMRIFRNMTDFSTTDPRDMVLATYHLASDIPTESFKPDYTLSIAETYSRFTIWIIRTTQSLEIMWVMNPGIQSKEVPSWVPCYNLRIPIGNNMSWVYEKSQASGESKVVMRPATHSVVLHIGGFRMATVAVLIDAKTINDLYYSIFRCENERHSATLPDFDILEIWHCVKYIYRAKGFERLPVTECLESTREPKFTPANFLRAFLQSVPINLTRITGLWARYDPDFAMLDSAIWYQEKMLRSIREERVIPNPEVDKEVQRILLNNRAFFFTENGELGQCPDGTQCGDIIVALYGSNFPFVLRPRPFPPGTSLAEQLRQGQKYQLVGACYLDGAMQGEKMNSPHWNDPLYSDPLDPDPCFGSGREFHRKGVYRTEFFHIE